jgi:hypothetical protein
MAALLCVKMHVAETGGIMSVVGLVSGKHHAKGIALCAPD